VFNQLIGGAVTRSSLDECIMLSNRKQRRWNAPAGRSNKPIPHHSLDISLIRPSAMAYRWRASGISDCEVGELNAGRESRRLVAHVIRCWRVEALNAGALRSPCEHSVLCGADGFVDWPGEWGRVPAPPELPTREECGTSKGNGVSRFPMRSICG